MTEATWTIGKIIDWARKDFSTRGFSSPRLDAELLLAHALGVERVQLYMRWDQPLIPTELTTIRGLIERRRKAEPIAYIVGSKEFYRRNFAVDHRVLIPRPETEELVSFVLQRLPAEQEHLRLRALDLGAGSGALCVTLALERKDLDFDAVDLSSDALAVARSNAEKLGARERIQFHHGSLYEPLAQGKYSLIVSNPPYLRSSEIPTLMRDVREFEPTLALDGGEDGAKVLRPLLFQALERLTPNGLLAVELSYDQAEKALELAREAGFLNAEIQRDLSGHERFLFASNTVVS